LIYLKENKVEEIIKHGSHNQASHGKKGGGAGAGGLSPEDDKKMNGLAVDMYNHKQSMPLDVRTGKNTPKAQAYRTKFTQIVDSAAAITGKTPQAAFADLNARMGVGS
jgi:hypothetical protein